MIAPFGSASAGPSVQLGSDDLDLPALDLLEGDRQVVLRPRLDERRREVVERPLAELVVVVVDLTRPLGGRDHERVAGVDVLEQGVDPRGWIIGRELYLPPRSRRRRRPSSSSTARSTSSFVDDVVEVARLGHLAPREREPLADLAGALGRALAQPSLELVERRGRDEDRTRRRAGSPADRAGAPGLELEDAAAAGAGGSGRPRTWSVPYRWPDTYTTCSRNSPAATRRSNSSSVRKMYSRPSTSPGRRGRVVADTATSRSARRSTSARIKVPLPGARRAGHDEDPARPGRGSRPSGEMGGVLTSAAAGG